MGLLTPVLPHSGLDLGQMLIGGRKEGRKDGERSFPGAWGWLCGPQIDVQARTAAVMPHGLL